MGGAHQLKLSVALVFAALALTGCVSRDPGPLSLTLQSFRTLEDPYHAEWIVEFRNEGRLPITELEVTDTHSVLYDSADWIIHGHEYRAEEITRKKYYASEPLEPPGLIEGPVELTSESPLEGGEKVFVRFVEYYHNYFSDQPEINATDFYAFTVGVHYVYDGYRWGAGHDMPCFDRDENRITIVEGGDICDEVSAINPDSPRWKRYDDKGWFG